MKLTIKEYLIAQFISLVLLMEAFNKILFKNLPGFDFVETRTIVAAFIIVFTIAGTVLNRNNRTIFSAITNSAFPVAILSIILYADTFTVGNVIAIASTVLLICIYTVFTYKKISIKKYMLGILRMCAVGVFVFLVLLSLKTVLFDFNVAPSHKMYLSNLFENTEVSPDFDSAISDLKNLNECKTIQEKVDILQRLYKCEAEVLGFEDDEVIVVADNLEEDENGTTYGMYENNKKVIRIDLDLIENGDIVEIYNTVVHEARHAYQFYITNNLYNNLDEEAKKLDLFTDVKKWSENNRLSMESDCREYAKKRTEEVFENSDYN